MFRQVFHDFGSEPIIAEKLIPASSDQDLFTTVDRQFFHILETEYGIRLEISLSRIQFFQKRDDSQMIMKRTQVQTKKENNAIEIEKLEF
jgi:hypothetical protein